jgi:GT2 family glycosyltransferase
LSLSGSPLVDVGIPTFGRPRYVREAVESVLAQSFSRWRLVIQEDGPGGGAIREAVEDYLSDPRVEYMATGSRVGPARNMTALLQSGSAPYVGLLHDDDLWSPEFLERRVRFLEAHPDSGMVFSGHVDIDGEGRRRGRSSLPLPAGEHGAEVFLPLILRHDVVATPTVLVRRSAYDAAGPYFDERFPHLYDWEVSIRLGLVASVGVLAEWDACYRWHGEQSATESFRAREYLGVFQKGDRLAAERVPELRVPETERRRTEARLLVSVALDDVAAGRPRAALRELAGALRTSPRVAADRRVPAALAGALLGRRARAAVVRMRARAFERSTRPDIEE